MWTGIAVFVNDGINITKYKTDTPSLYSYRTFYKMVRYRIIDIKRYPQP